MKLYEIDQAILDCIDQETGEIIDESKLDALEIARQDKLEGVACWYKDIMAEAEALKAEKMALAKRQQVAENKAKSLKNWLAHVLAGEKFNTPKAAVSFRNNKSVEITDLQAFTEYAQQYHDDLLTYKAPEPNKTAIKQALKDGENVPGATIKEELGAIIK